MDFRTRLSNAFKALTTNSLSDGRYLADRFRRYGNEKMFSDWSQVVMSESDKYTGYLYAAITNRAKKVAMLGKNHLHTTAKQELMKQAKAKEEPLTHPYLEVIDRSRTFSNYQFFYHISTFLDLKGRYYLFALRNKSGERTGDIQYFRLLNPYNIKRVIDEKTGQVEGYVEGWRSMTREIPSHMIIEIENLNPFSDDEPFAMTDAAKDSQFTLKTAGDHTRHSVAKNRATAGIVTINDDEMALDPQRLENFKARIKGKEKGEPIFGVGKGSISWNDMQIDLNKSALSEVSDVQLNQLIAVTGTSKTIFGHEETGGTKDRSDDQKNMFIDNHCIPQMQLILDALNQDYKNNYEAEYEKTKYELIVTSPTEDDQEGETVATGLRKSQFDLYQSLRSQGYSHETAAKYAEGEMELMEVGEPTEKKEPVTTTLQKPEEPEEKDNHLYSIHNQLDQEEQGVVTQQQGALENAVRNAEEQLTLAVLNKVTKNQKNQYEDDTDILPSREKRRVEKELETALAAFYLIVIPLYGRRILNRRFKELNLSAVFSVNADVKRYVKDIAQKSSLSHVQTITDDMLKTVRSAALRGASQQELVSAIRSEYNDIVQNRAKAIARTETNRAFTQAQFQADKQFIKQNDLEGRAYKKWVTRSGNPCALCLEMASRPPVPFTNDFIEFGSELSVTYEQDGKTRVQKQRINYEPLEAGNLHTNCSCIYQLIIE